MTAPPLLAGAVHDPRDRYRTTHSMKDLLLQRLVPTIQGWELSSKDLDNDPAFRFALRTERDESVVLPDNGIAIHDVPLLEHSRCTRQFQGHGEKASETVMEHMLVRNGGERLDEGILDVDAMPMATNEGVSIMVITSEPSSCRCL